MTVYVWASVRKFDCDRAVLDDFSAARKVFDEDEDLKTVAEALQLSQDGLQYDPFQLPAQMIGRIKSAPKVILIDR